VKTLPAEEQRADKIERNEGGAENADADGHPDNALVHRLFGPLAPTHSVSAAFSQGTPELSR